MRSAFLLFAVLVAGPAQGASATVRAGSNGEPCFSVDAQAERADGVAQFRAVTVVEPATGRLMWQMALPGDRSFALTHAICIPYAGRVPALPQTPAVALVAGRVYRVELAVHNAGNPKAPTAYTVDFCLAGKASVPRQLGGGASCPSVP